MLLKAVFLCVVAAALADDFCEWYPNGYLKLSEDKYCTYGCCDEFTTSDPCCHMSAGVIAGIVVGVIVFVIFVVVLALVGRRRYVTSRVQYVNHPAPPTVMATSTVQSTQQCYTGPPPPYGRY